MITALLLLVAAQDVQFGPTLPPGANRAVGEAVISIEEKLEKGDFAGAKAELRLLPKRTVTIHWDDNAVPKDRRAEFTQARDEALAAWKAGISGLDFKFGKPADLAFSFVKDLPVSEESSMPAGAVHSFSTGEKDPRLETVIGLNRGRPLDPIDASDLYNEVAYSVGSYLGLERAVTFGSFSSRTDQSVPTRTRISSSDVLIIRRIETALAELRAAVQEGVKLVPARPMLQVQPAKLTLPKVSQGEIAKFTIQVTNIGNAPLTMRVQPDCGCLVANFPSTIQAGRSALIEGAIDTTEFVGHLKKKLVFFTNDAERPSREIPVDVVAEPLVRLIVPGTGVYQMSESGAEVDAFMYFNGPADFKPVSARVDGVPAEVSIEPWSGMLADPELEEPEKQRQGYRIKLKMKSIGLPGRIPASLVVDTDSPKFRQFHRGLQFQKGIVALPYQLYMGDVGKDPRRFSFLVSRPETGFKIKSVESDNPFITATTKPVRGEWEHRVSVVYNGKADFGPLEGLLTIHTDDPVQPVIRVPVRGMVQ
jgi:hypothetical protein